MPISQDMLYLLQSDHMHPKISTDSIYQTHTFLLSIFQESASRVVRQYHYTGWPDSGSPESGTGLIDLIGQVQRWQQQSENTKITVHCRFVFVIKTLCIYYSLALVLIEKCSFSRYLVHWCSYGQKILPSPNVVS